MKWIQATERLPIDWHDNTPVFRAKSTGSVTTDVDSIEDDKIVYYLGTYKYTVPLTDIEWLEESNDEVVFTIENMEKCFEEAKRIYPDGSPCFFDFKEFMAHYHDINL